jgi:hypothetical protein
MMNKKNVSPARPPKPAVDATAWACHRTPPPLSTPRSTHRAPTNGALAVGAASLAVAAAAPAPRQGPALKGSACLGSARSDGRCACQPRAAGCEARRVAATNALAVGPRTPTLPGRSHACPQTVWEVWRVGLGG